MGDIKEFEKTVLVTNRMIEKTRKRLSEAIATEDWISASTLRSYIDGMNQTLIIFQQAETRIIGNFGGQNDDKI